MKVLILVALVGMTCAANVKMHYADELPEAGHVNHAKLDQLEKRLKSGEIPATSEEAEHIMTTLRKKREQVSAAWCCKQARPTASLQKPLVRSRVVDKEIPAGGSIKCGFAGWSRCSSSATVTVTVTEYYEDYEWIEIPSPEWNGGCPDPQLTCCAGYIYRSISQNCLTNREYEELVRLQMHYCHWDLGLLDTFHPIPYNIPCPYMTPTPISAPNK